VVDIVRALKVLVIVMGVLIIVGTGVVIAVIAARLAQNRAGMVSSATVAIPAGARIEAMTSAADRAIVALVLPDGSRQLLVIDLAQGRKLATIALRPTP
jgi:hypothetical protein